MKMKTKRRTLTKTTLKPIRKIYTFYSEEEMNSLFLFYF